MWVSTRNLTSSAVAWPLSVAAHAARARAMAVLGKAANGPISAEIYCVMMVYNYNIYVILCYNVISHVFTIYKHNAHTHMPLCTNNIHCSLDPQSCNSAPVK